MAGGMTQALDCALTPIYLRVASLIFGRLVAKYLAENGVSELLTFPKLFIY